MSITRRSIPACVPDFPIRSWNGLYLTWAWKCVDLRDRDAFRRNESSIEFKTNWSLFNFWINYLKNQAYHHHSFCVEKLILSPRFNFLYAFSFISVSCQFKNTSSARPWRCGRGRRNCWRMAVPPTLVTAAAQKTISEALLNWKQLSYVFTETGIVEQINIS